VALLCDALMGIAALHRGEVGRVELAMGVGWILWKTTRKVVWQKCILDGREADAIMGIEKQKAPLASETVWALSRAKSFSCHAYGTRARATCQVGLHPYTFAPRSAHQAQPKAVTAWAFCIGYIFTRGFDYEL